MNVQNFFSFTSVNYETWFWKKVKILFWNAEYIIKGCDFIMNWDRDFNDFYEQLGYITIGWDFIMNGEDF